MTVRRPAPLALALLALVLAIVPATALGASTKIVVSLKFPAFHGTLQSSQDTCKEHRTVKLFRQKPGADKLLGTDKSDAKGKWGVLIGKKKVAAGSYYAEVLAKHGCGAAKSKVFPVA
jgi:hypothetical protein